MLNKLSANRQKLILLLVAFISIMLLIRNNMQENSLPEKQYGIPVVIESYLRFDDTRITQILDDGNRMYVLVDSYRGYIQVFDLNGEYQYTLSFYHTLNGSFDMSINDNALYVRDSKHNIYVFHDGEFFAFIPKGDADLVFDGQDFNASSKRYEIRMGSVWRIDLEKPICVIQRSLHSFLYQYHLDWLFKFLFLGVVCILTVIKSPSKKSEKKIEDDSLS